MSKKLTVIFLVVLLAFNSAGVLFYYQFQLQACKVQARQWLLQNKKHLLKSAIVLSSADKDVKLTGHNEISYRGNMYDIIAMYNENSFIVYFAVSDDNEDKLVTEISAFAKNNAGNNDTTGKKISYEIVKFTGIANSSSALNSSNKNLPEKKHSGIFSFYLSPKLSVLYPPPKYIV